MARSTYKPYFYNCPKCESQFHKIKEVSDRSKPVDCTECGMICDDDHRIIKPTNRTRAINYAIIGAKVEDAEFNHGLGCVTKNKRHREEIARQKGVVEVGNDYQSGEKMQKEFEKKKQEELESNWKDPSSFTL